LRVLTLRDLERLWSRRRNLIKLALELRSRERPTYAKSLEETLRLTKLAAEARREMLEAIELGPKRVLRLR